jgi:hypothetical protein
MSVVLHESLGYFHISTKFFSFVLNWLGLSKFPVHSGDSGEFLVVLLLLLLSCLKRVVVNASKAVARSIC